MDIEQLDYELPPELIAERPVEPRDAARLLVIRRSTGTLAHHRFSDLPDLLAPHDCLVVNDTRVLPARVTGRREATGGRWEGLYLGEHTSGRWEMICQTRGKPQLGESIVLDNSAARLILRDRTGSGHWLVEPEPYEKPEPFFARHGRVPLPPYIRGGEAVEEDIERYQTVYAAQSGAVAAPTAGLHFTHRLMEQIERRGIAIIRLTLHVGLGTFQPIRESIEAHTMHAEWGQITQDAVVRIRQRRKAGGRIVAVGTTSVRLLETAASGGTLEPWTGQTDIFIRPPYEFRAVDALITNFHLPRTTLLALVFAFTGDRLGRDAYHTAVRERYRFYSYGDAMLIL